MLKRIEWLDLIKFFCIMCVMLSHLESATSWQRSFVGPFYLAAFFFISGYLTKYENFGKLIYKKFRGLFIPWFVFGLFNILLSQILSFNVHRNVFDEIVTFLLQMGGGSGIWFLAALFIAFIPFWLFVHLYETSNSWHKLFLFVLVPFLFSLASHIYKEFFDPTWLPWNAQNVDLPWHLDYIFIAVFYMVLGYIFKNTKLESVFDCWNTRIIRIGIVVVYFVLLIASYGCYGFLKIAYIYPKSLCGIMALVMICKKYHLNKYTAFVGANTLIYFALHGKCYSVIQFLLKKFAHNFYEQALSNQFSSALLAIVITIILSVMLILPAMFINKYLPFVIGKAPSKRTD